MFDYVKAVNWQYVPFGAEENDGGENNQQEQQEQQEQQNSGGKKTGKPVDKQDEEDENDPYKGLTTKELKRLLADSETKGKTAEDARKALQDKQDEDERKKRSDLENAQKDLEKEQSENAILKATNAKLAIINAINSDKRFDWHNPNIVAEQLNPEVVKVDNKGNVEGIAKELARIAKDHDYLLKAKAENNNGNGNQQGGNNNGQSTGFQPGQGGSANGGQQTDEAKLAEYMPALRSRM